MACLEDDWDNEGLHQTLLELCAEPSDLAEVATWYRLQTRDSARSSLANAQLRRLTARALLHLESKRSNPRPDDTSNRGKYLLIAFFLVGSAILAAYL